MALRTRCSAVGVLLSTLCGVGSVAAVPQAAPDSQAIIKSLRANQSSFERSKRHYLPWTFATRGGETERIGRFQFWYDEDETRPPPTVEHDKVVAARNALLAQLDSAALVLPGDDWILGQRVRYLTEVSRNDDALSRLDQCRGTPWWCTALRGFVHHQVAEFARADEVFATALTLMPDSLRCRWTDLSQVLDPEAARQYEDVECDERGDIEQHLWWLADPLLLVPGNERRTEHYARRVYDWMLRRTTSTFGLRWGKDNGELVIRFGWPVRWERTRPSSSLLGASQTVIGQQLQGAFRFLPAFRDISKPGAPMVRGSWHLDAKRPQARYAAPYAKRFVPLDHQLAAFQRNDSVIVVASYQTPTIDEDATTAKRFFGEALLGLRTTHQATQALSRGRAGRPLTLKGPREELLLTLETLSRRDSVAGRERYWIDMSTRFTAGFAISDLLLMRPASPLPRNLAQATPLALPVARVEPGADIGLFWEVYDPEPSGPNTRMSLTVQRVDKTFVRRAGEFLGLVGARGDRIEMNWVDTGEWLTQIGARSITLTLPDAEGRYLITIRASRQEGPEARSTRELEIRRPDPL